MPEHPLPSSSSNALRPADLGQSPWGHPPGVPYSPLYDDLYHSEAGAWAQAHHVFLSGNGLPGRWQARERFVILETGFGLGNNFLTTWAAWRADPRRCSRLVFISIEKHPLRAADLGRVHAEAAQRGEVQAEVQALAQRLHAAWPVLTPGLHVLDFDEAGLPAPADSQGVTLLLGFGDVADLLPALVASVDAFYLDGFAPARNPAMWDEALLSRLDRLAAPGATVATWTVARGVRDALTRSGFQVERLPGFGSKRDMIRASFAPRHVPEPLPGGRWPSPAPQQRHALVIGAGLAGCAAAWALTREGWQVTVLDRHGEPAQEASGNPGGLFHSILHAQESLHARAHRAAALLTAALAGPWIASGRLAGQCHGLLRLEPRLDDAQALARLARLGLPEDHVAWLGQAEASGLAGVPVPSGGWWFRQGGWLHPGGYARALLDEAWSTGHLRSQARGDVARLSRTTSGQWQALDGQGRVLGEAAHVVLANATALPELLRRVEGGPAPDLMPVTAIRGQVSWLASAEALRPTLPVAGAGYVLGLGNGQLLCGATSHHHDDDPRVREEDHRHNLAQAVRLGALTSADQADIASLNGRVGWRASTPDRFPLVGALPQAIHPLPGDRPWPDQVRRVPRLRDTEGGLYVIGGLGSRGITWAALAGRLLAHWVTGAPCPVEVDLRDAMDPARWSVRRGNTRAPDPL